jgi:flagellar biosynthesis protein
VNEADRPGSRLPDRPSAVALSSAAGGRTPVVVAKGYGVAAESIIERAREHGLYVHASPDLVKLLMHVDLDARVPPQLYAAVGEVLSWLHHLEASGVAATKPLA